MDTIRALNDEVKGRFDEVSTQDFNTRSKFPM
jgi:hypothetical protein